ncbi:hypothetical protein D3C78_1732750 [compost metagenome]
MTDVVMQFAAKPVTFVFLDLQQPVGQFLGLEFDRFAREAVLRDNTGQCRNVEHQQ